MPAAAPGSQGGQAQLVPWGHIPQGDGDCCHSPTLHPAGSEGEQGRGLRGGRRARADPVTGSTGQRDRQRTAMQQKGLLVIINN